MDNYQPINPNYPHIHYRSMKGLAWWTGRALLPTIGIIRMTTIIPDWNGWRCQRE